MPSNEQRDSDDEEEEEDEEEIDAEEVEREVEFELENGPDIHNETVIVNGGTITYVDADNKTWTCYEKFNKSKGIIFARKYFDGWGLALTGG